MTKPRFTKGQVVWLTGANVPVRYRNRSAEITDVIPAGKGFRYAVDLQPRRATPLVLGARSLTAA